MTRSRAFAAAVPVLALAVLAGLAGLAGLTGCGGEAVAPATPAKTIVEDFSTPEGTLATLDQAERAIDQLFGPTQSSVVSQQAGGMGQAQSAPAPVVAPPPPPPPPEPTPRFAEAPSSQATDTSARASTKNGGGEAPRAVDKPADSCSIACSALASMERATEHLCTLAGAVDTGCTNARGRVKRAEARVRASCPACGG